MSTQFHKLAVADIKEETEDSVSLYFDVNHSLKNAFKFKPGQYVNLRLFLNGKEERRSYSISSAPDSDHLVITVKKVKGGKVSGYLVDQLEVGKYLELSLPEGNFVVEPNADASRNHYMFAAGSGITPLMSMIRTLVEEEPRSIIHLLYGNRNESSIIFKEELDELQRKYEGQFFVEHILSRPHKKKEQGLAGVFKKAKTAWTGLQGRITPSTVESFLEDKKTMHQKSEYYVCGPGTMISTIYDFLLERGIDKSNIHREYFTVDDSLKSTPPQEQYQSGVLKVHLNQNTFELDIDKKTVLFSLLDAGYDPPYSCTNGTCSACMAKIINGKMAMDQCFALDEDEIAEGYVLTCQARLLSPSAEITYDI